VCAISSRYYHQGVNKRQNTKDERTLFSGAIAPTAPLCNNNKKKYTTPNQIQGVCHLFRIASERQGTTKYQKQEATLFSEVIAPHRPPHQQL